MCDFASAAFARVHDVCRDRDTLLGAVDLRVLEGEGGVALSRTEGEEHFVTREGLEVAVAHINVFGVLVVFLVSERLRGRVVGVSARDRVRQSAARLTLSGQDVGKRVSALHAALPYDEQRRRGQFLRPREVDGRADVQHDDGARECALHGRDQSLFRSGEVIAAGTLGAVTVFSRGASDEYDGDIASFRRLLDDVLREGHLGVGKRPVTPKAGINGIFRSPIIIEGEQDGIELHSRTLQSFDGGDEIGRAHVAAGAVADIEPIRLHPAEEGDSALRGKREHPVVDEEHAAVCGGFSCRSRNAREGFALHFSRVDVLHGAARKFVDEQRKIPFYLLEKVHLFPRNATARSTQIAALSCSYVLLNLVFRLFLGLVRAA